MRLAVPPASCGTGGGVCDAGRLDWDHAPYDRYEVMKYEDPSEWTPQSEAWVEAAGWTAEAMRARLRGDATGEAFARLAFQLCMQQTQETEEL